MRGRGGVEEAEEKGRGWTTTKGCHKSGSDDDDNTPTPPGVGVSGGII